MKKDCFVTPRRLRAALLTPSTLIHIGLQSAKGKRLRAALLATTALAAVGTPAAAQDATWLANPGSGDYFTGSNWSPASVPTGTATFGSSATTALTLGTAGSIGGWTFSTGASAYTFDITASTTFTGAGIVINGGSATIANNSILYFNGASTAGNASIANANRLIFNNTSTASSATISNSGNLYFLDTSTAGSATITNSSGNNLLFANSATADNAILTNGGSLAFSDSSKAGSAAITNSGLLSFLDNTTADHATITNNYNTVFSTNGTAGHATIANNASLYFNGNSTAGNANIANSTTGTVYFNGNSTAGNATIANNAYLYFNGSSTAGSATITNSVTGTVNFNDSSSAGSASITNNNTINFNGTSTAGNASITNGNNSFLNFYGNSTAGSANINNIASNSIINFFDTTTAGSAAITNSGALFFNNGSTAGSATVTNSGAVYFKDTSSAGSVTITGSGGVQFSGSSTAGNATITTTGAMLFFGSSTAGNATITSNGTLDFLNTSTAGSATITNNDSLTFFYNSTAGSASITNNSSLVFWDHSTAGNAAIVNNTGATVDFSTSAGPNGDGKLSAGSIAGGGTFYLGANELTVGGNNLSTAVTGVIADGGTGASLVKVGTGTLTLSGINTYTGGTTIAGGAISVSSDANLGGAAGPLTFVGGTLQTTAGFSSARNIALGTGGGTLQIDTGTLELSGTIADSGGTPGALTKTGAGTLSLTGNSSYSGATNILAGTLLASGTLSPDSAYTVAAGATLALDSPLQFIGSLAGAGTVTNAGASDARLVVGLDNSSTTFSGVVKDGATAKTSLWIDGTGVTTLTGANTYTGGTAICFCSTLQIGNGGTTGSIVGDVVNGGTLIFNRSNFYSFDGIISDSGADQGKLVKLGAGNTVLSGINTYTGTTTVDAGTLSVNGSIASSSLTTVNSGGTLGGSGFVGDTLINGGTLAPGNSIGTLTVSGSLTMTAASTYLVQISGASSDKTIVTGTATLAGKITIDPLTRLAATTTYTIVNAGALSGSFDTTTLLGSFARNARLSYVGNSVLLTLDPGLLSPNTPDSAGSNQKGVATAIDNALTNGGTMPNQFNALFALTGEALRTALTQASGETATGGQQTAFNAMTQFMGSMTDTFAAGRGGSAPGAMGFADDGSASASAPAKSQAARDAYAMFTKAPLAQSYDPRWSVWASGFGGSQTTDGSSASGSNTSTSRIYGVAAGADYRLSPDTIAGFAMAGGGTNFSVTGGGSGHSDLFQIGGFVRHAIGATYLSGALAYGWQDVTINRTVIADQLQARFNANTFSGRFEAGHRVTTSWLGGLGLTPYAAAQVTAIALPAYAETVLSGSNAFALSYAGKTVTDTRSELGLRSDKSFALDGALLTLRGRAAWAHDFNTDRAASATFLALPGASFVVNGAAAAHDAALTTASAEIAFTNGISLAATFEGEFSQVTRSYAGKGVARYSW